MIKRGSRVVVGDIPATAIEARHAAYKPGDQGKVLIEPVANDSALVWFGFTKGSYRVPQRFLEVVC